MPKIDECAVGLAKQCFWVSLKGASVVEGAGCQL